MKTVHRSLVSIPFLALLAIPALTQQSEPVRGHNNQSVGTNNGTVNQYNITVAPSLKTDLRKVARTNFGSDHGWLQTVVPGNDASPDIVQCIDPNPNNLTIALGLSNAASCKTDHCVVIEDTNPAAINHEILSLDRKGKSMQISLVIQDDSGKVIVLMDGNRTHANPNLAFDWRRPDSHTIEVYDQYNRRVLYLRFANPRVFYIEGIFTSSTGQKFTVSKDKMQFLGLMFVRTCEFNAGKSVFAF